LPLEQSSSQLVDDSHWTLHAPPEQSTLHGPVSSQLPSHCPDEQLQLPFVHESCVRALPAGRGSGSGGSELHATSSNRSKGRISQSLC
jgi:hypothetical protein